MRLLIFISMLIAWTANATTYYVDSNAGNDSWDGLFPDHSGGGTHGPWLRSNTVNTKQPATIVSGDIVLYNRGFNYGVTGLAIIVNNLEIGTYGSGNNPVITSSSGGNSVTFTSVTNCFFHDIDIASSAVGAGVSGITSASWITISNSVMNNTHYGVYFPSAGTFTNWSVKACTITNMTTAVRQDATAKVDGLTVDNSILGYCSSANMDVVTSTGSSQNIVLTNSTFRNSTLQGCQISKALNTSIYNCNFNSNTFQGLFLAGVTNVTITNISCLTNSRDGVDVRSSSGVTSTGVSVTNSVFAGNSVGSRSYNGFSAGQDSGGGSALTLVGCTFSNNFGDGFNCQGSWTGILLTNCTSAVNGTDGTSSDGDGISFHSTVHGTISHCISSNNWKSAITHVNSSQSTIEYCSCYQATNGTIGLITLSDTGTHSLANCTLYLGGSTTDCIAVSGGTVTITNCIAYGGANGYHKTGGTVTEDYNTAYGQATAGFSGLTASAHSNTTNPQIGSNIQLAYNSPAIGSGALIGQTGDLIHETIFKYPARGALEFVPTITFIKCGSRIVHVAR